MFILRLPAAFEHTVDVLHPGCIGAVTAFSYGDASPEQRRFAHSDPQRRVQVLRRMYPGRTLTFAERSFTRTSTLCQPLSETPRGR
jgi:hypothetical protein